MYPQYNQHWVDPAKANISWIGLLYAMCCMAMQSYIRTSEIPPEYEGTAPALIELYRVRSSQCLIVSDITKPVNIQEHFLPAHMN